MTARVDMIGARYGRLIGIAHASGSDWLFQCDCGQTKVINGKSVRSGNTSSCGCLHSEICSEGARERFTKHGLYGTPVYHKWMAMWTRVGGDENYVGRIFVCDRWKDVTLFLEDMGHPPLGMTLERENNEGDYTPDNCRWATVAEQNLNRAGCGKYRRSVLRHEENNRVILNVDGFWEYLIERETIRLRRASGLPREEWTADPIFRQFSFTNAKRSHDRTTTLLDREFYASDRSIHLSTPHEESLEMCRTSLLNCALFRFFGTIEMARALGWAQQWNDEQSKRVRNLAEIRLLEGQTVFTAAYIVPNCGSSAPKHEVVAQIIGLIWDHSAHILDTNEWRVMCERMCQCWGVGSFMAKEVLLDYLLCTGWTPADWEEWTPVGPGARLGAGWVRDDVLVRLTETEALEVIRSIYATRDEFWPSDYVPLDLTDVQFAFCEVAKYQKAFTMVGKPKRNFRPTVDDVTKKG